MKYRLIVNPTANKGRAGETIPAIHHLMHESGLDYDLVVTERIGHAVDLAYQASADGYDIVVAAGGDGTSNEVINGLMKAKSGNAASTAMGVLCIGRGNDFAYGAGVPHDPAFGVAALASNRRKWIDVAYVTGGDYPGGRYVGNGIGIGFDAVVGFEAAKLKWLSGFPSYAVAAIRTISKYHRAPVLRIQLDDHEITQPSLMVSIMNGRRMGGGFMMAPDSTISDGLFDICLAGAVPRRQILPLIMRFMKGNQATHPAISMHRTQKITVTAIDGVIPAHADGETLCTAGKMLQMELLPQQLEILSQN